MGGYSGRSRTSSPTGLKGWCRMSGMKKKTITTTIEKANIKEVRVSWDQEEVNKLLATGKWVLMSSGVAHQGTTGYQAKPCFTVARTE